MLITRPLALPAQALKSTLVVVSSPHLFSKSSQEHPLVVWMLVSQLYSLMWKRESILESGEVNRIILCFPRWPAVGKYMAFLKDQKLGPVEYLDKTFQLQAWLDELPVPEDVESLDKPVLRIAQTPLAVRIRHTTCRVYDVDTEHFLALSYNSIPKMAAVLAMRRHGVEFSEIALVCKLPEVMAKISAVQADMAIGKDRLFKQRVARIGRTTD